MPKRLNELNSQLVFYQSAVSVAASSLGLVYRYYKVIQSYISRVFLIVVFLCL